MDAVSEELKLPRLKYGRWAKVSPPSLKVVRREEGTVFELYVDWVLVGSAWRHPSGLGWKVKPEQGRQRKAPTLNQALELLRKLDQQFHSRRAR